MELRRLTPDSIPPYSLREGPVTLILVKPNKPPTYANAVMDKDFLLREYDSSTDVLMWPWDGQWKTDVFLLTQDDLSRYYRKDDYARTISRGK